MAGVVGAMERYENMSHARWIVESGYWIAIGFPVWVVTDVFKREEGYLDFVRLALSGSYWGGVAYDAGCIKKEVWKRVFTSIESIGKGITTFNKVCIFPGDINKYIFTPFMRLTQPVSDIASKIWNGDFNGAYEDVTVLPNSMMEAGHQLLQYPLSQPWYALNEGIKGITALVDDFQGTCKGINKIDGLNESIPISECFIEKVENIVSSLKVAKYAAECFKAIYEFQTAPNERLPFAYRAKAIRVVVSVAMFGFSIYAAMGATLTFNAFLIVGLITKLFAKYYEETVVDFFDASQALEPRNRRDRAFEEIRGAQLELQRLGVNLPNAMEEPLMQANIA